MGPGSFDPGSPATGVAAGGERAASMGPGSFDPGSEQTMNPVVTQVTLQWGRGLSTPEVGTDGRCDRGPDRFNGAGVFRPRKWQSDAGAPARNRGFNGAGVFRPRKSPAPTCCARRPPRFNGAGVFRPRKYVTHAAARHRDLALQWGRGLSTPEVAGKVNLPPGVRRLQWGRGLSTPEVTFSRWRISLNRTASMGPGSFDPGSS